MPDREDFRFRPAAFPESKNRFVVPRRSRWYWWAGGGLVAGYGFFELVKRFL